MDDFDRKIIDEIENSFDFLVKTRRFFHTHPELSGKEIKTSEFLKDQMKSLGLEIKEVKGTGFYAVLDTKKPGKTLGIRSDIDGLPIEENKCNMTCEKVSVSENKGIMHACGHDGHMAMLLNSAKILTKYKEALRGKIIFIFEEGEELGTGIRPMIEELKKLKIDGIYGNHLVSFMDVGSISFTPGPVMAGSAIIDFTVHGKGGHGSRPDLSINPIFAAANIINGLASAWVNQIDVTKTVTLGLGSINGGQQRNIIPDTVRVTGTMRFYDVDEGKKAYEVLKNVAENISAASRCSLEFTKESGFKEGPVINDEKLSNLANSAIRDLEIFDLHQKEIWFASESFSFYRSLAPSLFAFVGIRNREKGIYSEHHNEHFDMDERALKYGSLAQVKFAREFLTKDYENINLT